MIKETVLAVLLAAGASGSTGPSCTELSAKAQAAMQLLHSVDVVCKEYNVPAHSYRMLQCLDKHGKRFSLLRADHPEA